MIEFCVEVGRQVRSVFDTVYNNFIIWVHAKPALTDLRYHRHTEPFFRTRPKITVSPVEDKVVANERADTTEALAPNKMFVN